MLVDHNEMLASVSLSVTPKSMCTATGAADESHECAVCHVRVPHPSLSRPLTKSNCSLYDLTEAELSADMRVCNSCRFKTIHKRYMQSVLPVLQFY